MPYCQQLGKKLLLNCHIHSTKATSMRADFAAMPFCQIAQLLAICVRDHLAAIQCVIVNAA
jgi:hypothetical protein